MSIAMAELEETRFAHLLEPIRDLAQNWNINLANELEDYLSELESISISFDGGFHNLNFAEAALLIQGSACVYSKKVEYLYSLLYSTLDVLIKKKHKQNKAASSVGPDGVDADAIFDNDEPILLDLDSHLRERDNVDLEEAGETEPYAALRKAQLVHRPPLSLLSVDSTNLLQSSSTPSGGFKISNLAIHRSGALLLEERDRRSIDPLGRLRTPGADMPFGSPRGLFAAKSRTSLGSVLGSAFAPIGAVSMTGQAGFDKPPVPLFDEAAVSAAASSASSSEAQHDDYGMGDDADADDHNAGFMVASSSSAAAGPESSSSSSSSYAAGAGAGFDQGHFGASPAAAAVEENIDDDEADPWARLDPHDASTAVARPFRKAKTFVTRSARERAASRSSAASAEAFVASINADPLEDMVHRSIAKQTLQAPYFTEFASSFLRALVVKKRAERRQRITAAAASARAASSKASSALSAGMMSSSAPGVYSQDTNSAMGGIVFGGADGGDDDIDEDDGDAGRVVFELEALAQTAVGSAETRDQWSEVAGGPSIEEAQDDFAPLSLDTELAQLSKTYEDLCREHVENYLSHAQKYITESQLSRRVQEWQSRLDPILAEQEARKPFDIYEYGATIINKVQEQQKHRAAAVTVKKEEGETEAEGKGKEGEDKMDIAPSVKAEELEEQPELSLDKALEGQPPYEVCRLFLAALQLANSNNIDIYVEPKPEEEGGASNSISKESAFLHRRAAKSSELEMPDPSRIKFKLLSTQRLVGEDEGFFDAAEEEYEEGKVVRESMKFSSAVAAGLGSKRKAAAVGVVKDEKSAAGGGGGGGGKGGRGSRGARGGAGKAGKGGRKPSRRGKVNADNEEEEEESVEETSEDEANESDLPLESDDEGKRRKKKGSKKEGKKKSKSKSKANGKAKGKKNKKSSKSSDDGDSSDSDSSSNSSSSDDSSSSSSSSSDDEDEEAQAMIRARATRKQRIARVDAIEASVPAAGDGDDDEEEEDDGAVAKRKQGRTRKLPVSDDEDEGSTSSSAALTPAPAVPAAPAKTTMARRTVMVNLGDDDEDESGGDNDNDDDNGDANMGNRMAQRTGKKATPVVVGPEGGGKTEAKRKGLQMTTVSKLNSEHR